MRVVIDKLIYLAPDEDRNTSVYFIGKGWKWVKKRVSKKYITIIDPPPDSNFMIIVRSIGKMRNVIIYDVRSKMRISEDVFPKNMWRGMALNRIKEYISSHSASKETSN